MSEREILLRLDGAGEKLCRECAHTLAALGCGKDTAFQRLRSLRTHPCLAAERAAAELREDARYKARWERLKASANPWVLREMRKLEAENE